MAKLTARFRKPPWKKRLIKQADDLEELLKQSERRKVPVRMKAKLWWINSLPGRKIKLLKLEKQIKKNQAAGKPTHIDSSVLDEPTYRERMKEWREKRRLKK